MSNLTCLDTYEHQKHCPGWDIGEIVCYTIVGIFSTIQLIRVWKQGIYLQKTLLGFVMLTSYLRSVTIALLIANLFCRPFSMYYFIWTIPGDLFYTTLILLVSYWFTLLLRETSIPPKDSNFQSFEQSRKQYLSSSKQRTYFLWGLNIGLARTSDDRLI